MARTFATGGGLGTSSYRTRSKLYSKCGTEILCQKCVDVLIFLHTYTKGPFPCSSKVRIAHSGSPSARNADPFGNHDRRPSTLRLHWYISNLKEGLLPFFTTVTSISPTEVFHLSKAKDLFLDKISSKCTTLVHFWPRLSNGIDNSVLHNRPSSCASPLDHTRLSCDSTLVYALRRSPCTPSGLTSFESTK